MDRLQAQLETYLLWQTERGQKYPPRYRGPAVSDREPVETPPVLVMFLSDVPLNSAESDLLEKMTAAIRLERKDFQVKVVTDWDPSGQLPTPESIDRWRDQYLCDETAACAKAIVPLGALATRIAFGKGSFKALRGTWQSNLLPTFHPRDLIRLPQYKVEAWQDLQNLSAGIRTESDS